MNTSVTHLDGELHVPVNDRLSPDPHPGTPRRTKNDMLPTSQILWMWPDFLRGQRERPVRVLLVDDSHARRLVSQDLALDQRILVAGETGSLSEARRLLSQHEFDVLVLDIRLDGGSGFELIEHAKRCSRTLEVIVNSSLEDEHHILHAFELGASGYLVKNSWQHHFAQAVLQVVNGGAAISPCLARRLLLKLADEHHPQLLKQRVAHAIEEPLSARECEVLRLVAAGNVTHEIAQALSISGQTVCAHIKSIYRKMRVHTRAHAVVEATNRGLL